MKKVLPLLPLLLCSFRLIAQAPTSATHAYPTGGCEGVNGISIESVTYDNSPVFVMMTGKSYKVNVLVGSGIIAECSGNLTLSLVQDNSAHGIGGLSNAYSSYVNAVTVLLTNIAPGVYDLSARYDTYQAVSNASQKISVIDVTGVTPLNEISGISIFPNPASDNLLIDNKNSDRFLSDISIMDMNGRRLKNTRPLSGGSTSIDVRDLPSGMYILQLISADKTEYRKFIVHH